MDKQNALNHAHSLLPEAGDFWTEMLGGVAVVLDVTTTHVITCEKLKTCDDDQGGRVWDLHKTKTYTRARFENRWRYGAVTNARFKPTEDLTKIKNKCWCDVSPRLLKEVAEYYKSEIIQSE